MTGIIIVTHSNMAEGIKDAAEMILGEKEGFFAVGYYVGESLEDLYNKIENVILENTCEEWVIFTDMFGDTPSNVASIVCTKYDAVVVTGANLGMIIETLVSRDSLKRDEFIDSLLNVGKSDIRYIDRDIILNNIEE
ncbi:PTS sugar transporter subunit IIA [Sporanaerobacter acetigenes]|uniref:PTS sugar transporter subunit IIA n=1 Tax=Sporanaerobacter acetigenes TaxID=165813 RepID=UPI0010521C30|nr:PTS sugar transporter subunit IIA [Sporanaerobacter acetigenes]